MHAVQVAGGQGRAAGLFKLSAARHICPAVSQRVGCWNAWKKDCEIKGAQSCDFAKPAHESKILQVYEHVRHSRGNREMHKL